MAPAKHRKEAARLGRTRKREDLFKGGKGDLQWTSRDKAEVEAENSILELIDECCQLRFILRNLKTLRLSLSVIAQFVFKMVLIA